MPFVVLMFYTKKGGYLGVDSLFLLASSRNEVDCHSDYVEDRKQDAEDSEDRAICGCYASHVKRAVDGY